MFVKTVKDPLVVMAQNTNTQKEGNIKTKVYMQRKLGWLSGWSEAEHCDFFEYILLISIYFTPNECLFFYFFINSCNRITY